MTVYERFLKYVSFPTTSDENNECGPSTEGQRVLAEAICEELLAIGISDARVDEHGYVYASIPANCEGMPAIGFIAHLDTASDAPGENIRAKMIDYKGGDILLNEEQGIVLSLKDYPYVADLKGQRLIVTDGRTLLGADDKAGVAEIMAAAERLVNADFPHGKICIGFTPDEEIGRGADYFDVEKFGADYAYTVDGGALGELEYENFNAASARITIKGRNVHPGYAKDKMLNSMRVATEFVGMLPKNEVPECTDGYEGFFHLVGMKGGVEETTLSYIIRDHSSEIFNKRKELLHTCVRELNKKYGDGIVTLELNDQYANMREVIEPVMYVIDIACQAMREVDVEPKIKPIRGGTDGAQLSFKGLPCPNIFAGGVNFHSRYEFVPVQSMQKAMMTIVKIAEIVGKG